MSNPKKPKIIIKPFRQQVQMDPNYAQKTWKLLKGAIHEIHKQNASGLSFEELYRNAYNMVLHKHGDTLYEGLEEVVTDHLKSIALLISSSVEDNFLQELNKHWNEHKTSMLMIRDILMYMDRVYVPNNNVKNVYDLGLVLFKQTVANHEKIKDRLLATLLTLIRSERASEVIDRSMVKSITQMLMDLGINSRSVYESDFEKHFLEESATFYRVESQEFISSNSCSDYMKKVEGRLKEELARVAHYLDANTEPKIRAVAEHELIFVHMKSLVEMENSGMVTMMRDDKIDDLKRMYNLFSRVPKGLDTMKDLMSSYVRDCGSAIVNDEEKAKEQGTYVQSLLTLKDKYDKLLSAAFNNDKSFQHSLNQSFEYFINLNQKSPEYISLFIDEKLKKGLKGVSDEEIEIVLDKVMMLFRFIQEKDVFEKYYKQHLAKRLLLGRSVSDDAERNMIAKLKTECGYQFTSKLEGMFTDMKLSADTMDGFKQHLDNLMNRGDGAHPLGGIELNVYVLTTGFWPTQSAAKCNFSNEILTCCEVFKKYYLSNHNGRRISWQANMGTSELKATFGAKKHELTVTTYQMVILLLFNDSAKLTFKEIAEATGIPHNDLKRNLLALTSIKNKILDKEASASSSSSKEENEAYVFNSKFKSKLFKVKVVALPQKETAVEEKETRQKVNEDREHQIEAAIVRIMKARKSMEHANLIAEVTRQLSARFMPNPIIIKKRVESLIEREYLERSKADRKLYNYLA
eukprot:TRINITY_DN2462_c0_g1_i1.p1 TRINITY_DN2462_c0_g1~~TRINITY_DN2462_c0_g1_i1.p1  ORF type:complete len:745 (-),score=221.56 TRINITY_DN2462_c0_g1_i1:110-2344(-)